MLRAFALFDNNHAYAAISKKKIYLDTCDATGYPRFKAKTEALDVELLDVLISDDQDIIVLCKDRSKFRVFRVVMDAVDGLECLRDGVPLDLHNYSVATDSCCLVPDSNTLKQCILIASREDGKLYQTPLG